MAHPASLKGKLRSGDVALGSWVTLAHPAVAEIMAKTGFDWLAIDLEHSVIALREAEELIRIVELCGVTPLVRISANDPVEIKRVMDAGAHGIIVPMVNCKEDAERAISAVHYPTRGQRSVGLARAQGYGTRFDEYREWLRNEAIVIVQVEHIESVRNLDGILNAEGVDGFIVGPYDLSGSLGEPGRFESPAMIEALKEILRIAEARNAVAGFHVVSPQPDSAVQKIKEGYRLVAYGVDMLFLGEMSRTGLRVIKDQI